MALAVVTLPEYGKDRDLFKTNQIKFILFKKTTKNLKQLGQASIHIMYYPAIASNT